MPRDPARLLQEALELLAEARAERAWHEEIDRRLASLDEGTAQPIPWDEVRAKLSGQLRRLNS
jgi:putative addiction module component (TIGR02574 family)